MSKSSYTQSFSHMAEAFLTPPDRAYPRLPLAEYIVESGLHRLSTDTWIQVKGGQEEDRYCHHYHARWEFPNGRVVSAISGHMFNCSPDAPYEVWLLGKDGKAEADPRGYVDDAELMLLLIQEMEK